MMKARVNIQTATRNYAPGEVIEEKLSALDIAFLKKNHFLLEVPEEKEENPLELDVPLPEMEEEEEEISSAGYKEEAALKKMNKEELVDYAESIGLSLTADMLKNDMMDALLNYIEERMG